VELIDPRNFFYFWYVAKHHIKGGKATWIYNGRKVFEGIPSFEEVDRMLMQGKNEMRAVLSGLSFIITVVGMLYSGNLAML